MPKKAKELTARAVVALKDDGRYAVGGVDGLHLRIAGASRSWVLRVVVGQRRDIGLGSFPEIGLAEARDKARELRKQVRDGIDPLVERRQLRRQKLDEARAQDRRKTFADYAEAVIRKKSAELRNAKALAQWRSTLEAYAYPFLNDGRKIDELAKGDVLNVLTQPIVKDGKATNETLWAGKTETASRLRGRIETVFDFAKADGAFTGDNPAAWKGTLEPLLPKPKKLARGHHAALPYAYMPLFMAELRKRVGMSARALEFSILTAARSGEVRGARFSEIDMVRGLWIIPAERMKAGKEHRVPLTPAALALLRALPQVEGSDFVFPATRGGALSDQAFQKLFERMGQAEITQHGFRSTFRDWAGETTAHPREVIEHALAHRLKDKAEAAYARGDLMSKRLRLMTDWGRYCDGQAIASEPSATVVALREVV